MRIGIVLGTRPEIIKMSPIIRACQRRRYDFFLLHTGQHYSRELDRVFFEGLGLPDPDHHLDVGSGLHGAQTAKMLAGIEAVLMRERPDVVLVQGDTNTVLAGALAASKLGQAVGHVEAGLRSGDRTMPEELNRIVADHLSDYCFAPTRGSAKALRAENIPASRIHVTGNTIVDAVRQNLVIARRKSRILSSLGLRAGAFILMTAHRQENVDVPGRFKGILDGADRAGRALDIPVVYPIHPRSRKQLEQFHLDAGGLRLVPPLDFFDFLTLEASARVVITDSGGVQEETCILGVPCVTVRDNTERPETLEVGSNALAGTKATSIVQAVKRQDARRRRWRNPFGDGRSGERILDILRKRHKPRAGTP